jgi:transposase
MGNSFDRDAPAIPVRPQARSVASRPNTARRTIARVTDARTEAARLFARGASRAEVARRLGVARSTAGEWYRRWRASGTVTRTRPGPRPRLGPSTLAALADALLRSPREAGLPLERWSMAAVARWIEARTGVAHHPRHVGRVLARAGFVVPPFGASAGAAQRRREARDSDGNAIALYARGPLSVGGRGNLGGNAAGARRRR